MVADSTGWMPRYEWIQSAPVGSISLLCLLGVGAGYGSRRIQKTRFRLQRAMDIEALADTAGEADLRGKTVAGGSAAGEDWGGRHGGCLQGARHRDCASAHADYIAINVIVAAEQLGNHN